MFLFDSIVRARGSCKGSTGLCYDPPVPEMPSPIWVDRPHPVRELAEQCRSTGRCALDTEADSLHSYFHKVCLVQVSVGGSHYVVDPLAVGAAGLAPLFEVLADPALSVLMHGADYDIRVLDRDYGARIAGLEDTQVMAQMLGEPKTGLAALLAAELDVGLDKRYQRADWGQRPLSASMLAYAAADTAFLGNLAERLRARLVDLGRWCWAEEDFLRLERVRHVPQAEDPLAFEKIKGARVLRGEARDRLFSLHGWRETIAQAARRPSVQGARQPGAGRAVDGPARRPREHLAARLGCRSSARPPPGCGRPEAARSTVSAPEDMSAGRGRSPRCPKSAPGSSVCSPSATPPPPSSRSSPGCCARERWSRRLRADGRRPRTTAI